MRIKGYLAQSHMVMGQEERKNKAKLEKAQLELAKSNAEYENAIKALEETTYRWNRDWKIACDVCKSLNTHGGLLLTVLEISRSRRRKN